MPVPTGAPATDSASSKALDSFTAVTLLEAPGNCRLTVPVPDAHTGARGMGELAAVLGVRDDMQDGDCVTALLAIGVPDN
jgi:hypothetical protein